MKGHALMARALRVGLFMSVSGRLRGVADGEVEGAGRDLAEAPVAVERDGDADGRVLTRELESAFEQTVVELVDVERPARLAEQDGRGVGDGALEEAVALRRDVRPDGRDVVAEVLFRLLLRRRLALRVGRVRLRPLLCGAGVGRGV